MRKIVSKIAGVFATLGVVSIAISIFFSGLGYIFFWSGIVVVIISGIAYIATGEKVKDWFWELLDII